MILRHFSTSPILSEWELLPIPSRNSPTKSSSSPLGFPDRDNASFSDLSLTTQLALTCLVSVMDRKMRDFSGVPGVRAIARTDGFVVPDHPHIVMFPALRGESDAYTKPSRFTDEAVRKKLVQNTLRNLALTANEKVELDEELNWLEYVGIPS